MNYSTVTLVCFIFAGVFFIVSVVLFFVLDMVKVIGDLTGHTAKREIENIRSQNQRTGTKVYKSSKVNEERGKLTDKISDSGNIIKNHSNTLGGSMGTEKIGDADYRKIEYEDPNMYNQENVETTLLNTYDQETSVLSYQDEPEGGVDTSILNYPVSAETSVLAPPGSDETTLLNEAISEETSLLNINVFRINAQMIQEIIFINTDEIIS